MKPNTPTNGKDQCAQTMTPHMRISEHRRRLDDVLVSIKGFSDESELTRQFIVGQIEALDWVLRLYE